MNFTTAMAAFKFYQHFNGHKFSENNKTCEITKALFQVISCILIDFQDFYSIHCLISEFVSLVLFFGLHRANGK